MCPYDEGNDRQRQKWQQEHEGQRWKCAPPMNLEYLVGTFIESIMPCFLHCMMGQLRFLIKHGLYAEVDKAGAHLRLQFHKYLKGFGVHVPKNGNHKPIGRECSKWFANFRGAVDLVFDEGRGKSDAQKEVIRERKEIVMLAFERLADLNFELLETPVLLKAGGQDQNALDAWSARVDTKGEEYRKRLIKLVGKASSEKSVYAHILFDILPLVVKQYGDVTVFSGQGLEHCNKMLKVILRTQVSVAGRSASGGQKRPPTAEQIMGRAEAKRMCKDLGKGSTVTKNGEIKIPRRKAPNEVKSEKRRTDAKQAADKHKEEWESKTQN